MSEIKTLLMLELRSFYGINKFLHTKDIKYKKRYKSLGFVWLLLIAMIFTYIGGLVFGLCSFGLSSIVPAYLVLISSFIIVFFGMFSIGNRIFGLKGYDILVSMPIKPASIVISRFLGHYIADLLLTVAIMLPGMAVYGYFIRPNILFYILALVATAFVPIIPLVIATVFGAAVMAISSRMKNKSMVQSLLSVLLVVGIMSVSFGMEGVSVEQFKNFAEAIGGLIGKIYLPAIWLNNALIKGNVLYLLLFAFISVIFVTLTVLVVAKKFNAIVVRLLSFTAKHNYKLNKIESHGMLKALYIKEIKRYFASSIYVTNTIIGPIMGTIMSVALCVVGLDTVTSFLPINFEINSLLPFIFSAMFSMMTTTSVSISMEGKHIWIAKSLPIPMKTWLDSKILLNLTLMSPFYIISQIAFAAAMKPSVLEFLWMLLIPTLIVLFVTVFGITVNLKFHSFDWEKEETVVKQSLPAALGGFAGLFLSAILGVLVFLGPLEYLNILKTVICLVLSGVTAVIYKANIKKDMVTL